MTKEDDIGATESTRAPLTAQGPQPPGSVAIVGATVIDATGAAEQNDTTIVVVGAQIVALGPAAEITVPRGARIVDGRGKFVIPGLWEMAQRSQQDAEQRSAAVAMFERQLQVTADLHHAGINLMAGTDTFVPGFSLHDELALLVRAGLSEMEALQAATRNPARYLGLADSLGTIAEGKIADLVVLDGNPLDDIRHTRDIHALLLGGSLLDSATLAGLTRKFDDTTG